MSIVLSLISGKGGSGKTTIGLAIAKLLSKCEKKVLLVDCDTSTHGATYFFESTLTNDIIDNISTTRDFLDRNILVDQIRPIRNVNDIDFIPSVKKILIGNNNFEIECGYTYEHFKTQLFVDRYDVIIFDCQAGYTDFTKSLINISDVCLFVLEADSVSASAMRALYTQLSSELTRSSLKSYQIFNKLRRSEMPIYSGIKYGTFFTNLKPVLFDWSVRNAFQENMIPLVNENTPSFTSDICNLTRNLFPAFKEEILNYEINVKNKFLSEEKEKLHKISKSLKSPLVLQLFDITTFISALLSLILLVVSDYMKIASTTIALITVICLISLSTTVLTKLIKDLYPNKQINNERIKADEMTLNIKSLEKEIELLTDQIPIQ